MSLDLKAVEWPEIYIATRLGAHRVEIVRRGILLRCLHPPGKLTTAIAESTQTLRNLRFKKS